MSLHLFKEGQSIPLSVHPSIYQSENSLFTLSASQLEKKIDMTSISQILKTHCWPYVPCSDSQRITEIMCTAFEDFFPENCDEGKHILAN